MLERFEILLSSVLVESDVLTFERLTPGRHRERRARGLCSSTMRVLLLLLCLVCRRVPGFRPPPRIPTSWRLASSPSEDLYEALGVPSTADDSMLRRAYVKRAKLLHPDVNPSPEAATDFRRIAEAYEVLRDERKRKRYDNERFAEKVSEIQNMAGSLSSSITAEATALGHRQVRGPPLPLAVDALALALNPSTQPWVLAPLHLP